MATPTKVSAVAEITNDFKESNAAVLTEYRGLTVAQLKQLRVSLGQDTKFSVVKNTLTAIAAKEAGVEAFDGQLSGPTAIAFIKGDAVAAAKSLTDFAKANKQLVIKTGYFEGKALNASEVTALAALESRELQLAKVAGILRLLLPPLHASSTHCASSLKKRTVHRQLPRLPPLKKLLQLKKPPKQLQRPPPKHPLPKRTIFYTTRLRCEGNGPGRQAPPIGRTPHHGEAHQRRAH